MFKKLLHRITVVWCLYGLVRLCMFANPWVFRFIKIFRPLYDDNSWSVFIEDVPWDNADPYHILFVWLYVALALGIIVAILAGIHHFSNWFFNTETQDEA